MAATRQTRQAPKAESAAIPDDAAAGGGLINPMDRYVGYKMRRIKHAIISELNTILSEFELRIMDFAVLSIVETNPGIFQNEITHLVGAEPPALVLSLDRLEKANSLYRQFSPTDRRLRTLHLTPEGRKLIKKVTAKVERQERGIKNAVRGDLDQFVANLDDVMQFYGIR